MGEDRREAAGQPARIPQLRIGNGYDIHRLVAGRPLILGGQRLEHPHYTRPAVFRDQEVPAVLRSGDHGAIARWRQEQQELRTQERRPDLHARWRDAGGISREPEAEAPPAP